MLSPLLAVRSCRLPGTFRLAGKNPIDLDRVATLLDGVDGLPEGTDYFRHVTFATLASFDLQGGDAGGFQPGNHPAGVPNRSLN